MLRWMSGVTKLARKGIKELERQRKWEENPRKCIQVVLLHELVSRHLSGISPVESRQHTYLSLAAVPRLHEEPLARGGRDARPAAVGTVVE